MFVCTNFNGLTFEDAQEMILMTLNASSRNTNITLMFNNYVFKLSLF